LTITLRPYQNDAADFLLDHERAMILAPVGAGKTAITLTAMKDALNNKIENLRPCTRSENALNSKRASNNKSGVKGVCWHKAAQKWHARINLKGKQYNFGSYITKMKQDGTWAKLSEKEKGAIYTAVNKVTGYANTEANKRKGKTSTTNAYYQAGS